MRTKLLTSWLFLALLLPACTARLTDITPVAGPEQVATPTPAGLSTPQPATPTPLSVADFGLTGQFLFLTSSVEGQKLVKLDLVSGALTTLFAAPNQSWMSDGAVSPDGRQIVVTYAPPPAADKGEFSPPGLYTMPLAGAGSLLPILEPDDRNEAYSTPAWSPDGRYLYYSHLVYSAADGYLPHYTIERWAYPGGQPQVLVKDGLWPSLSPDGSKLAYLSFNLDTQATTLSLADADGAHAVPVLAPDAFPIVDAHFFTPDGQQIIFSAVGEQPVSQGSDLEKWLGVGTARAHNLPSDWWRISVGGGQPERLTQIYSSGLYGAYAPDGSRIAFIDYSGLYLMNPDGSEIAQLLQISTWGMLAWVGG
jgi:Tol biopolymer transport system component